MHAQDYVPGEVIVKMKVDASQKGVSFSTSQFKSKSSKEMTLQQSFHHLRMHKMSLKPGQSVESMIQILKSDPNVEYAEPNYIVNKSTLEAASHQVELNDARAAYYEVEAQSGSTFHQSNANMQVEGAWSSMSGGAAPAVVAVIDTGVDYNHDVFVESGAMWNNPGEVAGNGIDDDGNGYVDDIYGWNFVNNSNNPMDDDNHGTHVAGIVLGSTQNILASSLSSARIKIMALKFLDNNGSGTTSDAIAAINYAVANGAKVLNNSWGGGGYSQALKDAISASSNAKTVFIAAAGNAGSNNDSFATYPANYSIQNVISIAATNDYDYLASFSNYGRSSVHIASPGVSIYSTLPGNSMGYLSGTSMAAPFVAGLAAMMVREEPAADGFQVKTVIGDQANRVLSLENRIQTESRINMANSVSVAANGQLLNYQPASQVDIERDLASDLAGGGGCAAVTIVKDFMGGGKGGPQSPYSQLRFIGLLLVLLSPIMIILNLRKAREEDEGESAGENRRRFTRYKVDTEVQIFLGSQQLAGAVSCISVGGVRIDTDQMLNDGNEISMKIKGPGSGFIEAKGEIVWSKDRESYGVKFSDIDDNNKTQIEEWSKRLDED